MDLTTKAKITWCPGCPDAAILVSFRQALTELVADGKEKEENFVALAGIGCHGKITDYLGMNTFTSLHGRSVPTATGIKVANPSLRVAVFSGDGDSYAEGIEHLVHAAKRNTDIKLFVHDNKVFALTTGQATPTSPKGFKGRSTPFGNVEEPLDPLLILLASGATFVARSYALDIQRTKEIMKQALFHKGFAIVDILQPCITFNDLRAYYEDKIYWVDDKFPTGDVMAAEGLLRNAGDKYPLGIFYRTEKPTFEEMENP